MDNPIQRKVNPISGPTGRPPTMPPHGPRPPMAPPAGAGGMAMSPKEIVGILRRHIWMIIIFTVTGTMIGAGLWFLCDQKLPKYESVRAIIVDQPVDLDPMQVAKPQAQADTYNRFRSTMTSYIQQDFMLQELLNKSPKVRVTDWFKNYAKLDAEGNIVGDEGKAVGKALKDLQKNLGASAPRGQNFILVSMKCGNPSQAKTIVDEMVRLYLSQQQEQARISLKSELVVNKLQRDKIQGTLDQLENGLTSIRSGTRFARLNMGAGQGFRDYIEDKLSNLETSYNGFETEKGRLTSVINTLKARVDAYDFDERVQEQVEADSVARQIRGSIEVLEPELNRQLSRFGGDHRSVKNTQAALAELYARYAERQRAIGDILRQSNLMAAEESMAALVQELDTVEKQLQATRADYREIDRIRTEYSRLEERRQENLGLLKAMNTLIAKKQAQHDDPKLSKLSSPISATLPRVKSFPKKNTFFPGGFFLGMLAGVGLAFLIELMNDLLRSPSDIMRHLKCPLMGMVCHVDDDPDVEGVDLYHVVRQAPYSIMSECYRQLRTNLKLSDRSGGSKKTLFITSGEAGDGKTTVAVNLISTMLAENRNVLLMDANFRRPSISRLFPDSQADGTLKEFADFGLSNYLMGQCDTEDQVIRDSGIEGLYIIDSGPLPANPAELLSGKRMQTLLEHCKSNFDYVLIDGPPTLVSDSKTLASLADGTIVVFNASSTRRGVAMRILRELRETHADIVGTVLMAVRSRKGGYFREYYRSYQQYQRVQLEQPV